MIEETGTVVGLEGDYARVQTQRRSVCGRCSAQSACGTSLLERLFSRRSAQVIAMNDVDAAIGDRVLIGISEGGLMVTALAAYLVPTLALVGGAMAGSALGGGDADTAGLLGGLLGLTLAMLWLRGYSAAIARDPRRRPIIVRKLDAGSVAVTFVDPS